MGGGWNRPHNHIQWQSLVLANVHPSSSTTRKLTNQVTPWNSLFWEAYNHSASSDTACLLWNLKVHYYAHKACHWTLSWTTWIQTTLSHLLKIHSNITLPSIPSPSIWSLPFRFTWPNFVWISHFSRTCYMPCPSHPLWLDHLNNNLWRLQLRRSSLSNSLLPAVTFSLLGRNILLSTLLTVPHFVRPILLPESYFIIIWWSSWENLTCASCCVVVSRPSERINAAGST